MFGVEVTNDGKYLILDTRKDCDDLGLIGYTDITGNALTGKLEFTPLINEWIGGFSYLHNVGSQMYFKTNFKATRSRVIMIDVEQPINNADINASMHDVIPEHAKNVLNEAECINGLILAYYLENASDKMTVFDLATPANEVN